jgi:hypothetical protein
MSVPLDRLYNFLNDVCNRAVVIYRWLPHGSKKLNDLSLLHELDPDHWSDDSLPSMICHDQEPLFYDLYTESDIRDQVLSEEQKTVNPGGKCWFRAEIDFLSKLHLRGLIYIEKLSIYDKILILHSEKRSEELKKYEANDYIGVYYWSHALISADWYRYAQHDPKLIVDFSEIKKDFLIYNRAWTGTREYRLTFMHELVNQDLQSTCLTSFAQTDNGHLYLDHEFKNLNLSVDLQGLSQHFPPNQHDSAASADYNNTDYSCIAIEVILETLFDDSRLHLTEKTLRPIACGRPFILMSTQGSLQYLREYGFRTFDGLIDETYDTIADPKKRLQAVIQEMSRLAALDTQEKYNLWNKLYEIANFNKQLLFSQQWQQSIHQEFLTNLTHSLGILEQHKNKIIQHQIEKIWSDDPSSKIYSIN